MLNCRRLENGLERALHYHRNRLIGDLILPFLDHVVTTTTSAVVRAIPYLGRFRKTQTLSFSHDLHCRFGLRIEKVLQADAENKRDAEKSW